MHFATLIAIVALFNVNYASAKMSKRCKTAQKQITVPNAIGDTTNNAVKVGAKNDTQAPVYGVQERFAGISFWDGFNFDTFPDPTHGNVNYVSRDSAFSSGLAYVDEDDVVIMKVDNTKQVAPGGNRDSVRISSKNSYASGLIVLDLDSMPFGCGVWPAFWTVGEGWPNGGEIDILEGVNNAVRGQYTLHTAPGCQIDRSFEKLDKRRRRSQPHRRGSKSNSDHALAFTGTVLSQNCDATINSNIGCGVQDPSDKSYGSALNNNGGGVFATLLNDEGVAIWFFPRGSVPADLEAQKPKPSTWSSPRAFWSSSLCPTKKIFGSQRIVINTTLCGDWAGAVYSSDGCPGTCAQRVANPRNFDTAQWKIRSVTVYN